ALPSALSMTEEGLTIGPWILSLGMHTLAQQQGLLDPAIGDPYRLLFKHLHYLLNGHGWQPLFDPGDDDALDRSVERLCRDVFDAHCPYPPTDVHGRLHMSTAPTKRKPRFALRLILMLLGTALVFGGVFAVKAMIGAQTNKFFDNMPQPAA